jgi:hypothetical protein
MATAAQVPLVHVAHAPEQALLQQTPLTQLPLWHWSASVHDVPFCCVPEQSPSTQLAVAHWSEAAQGDPTASVGTQTPPLLQ